MGHKIYLYPKWIRLWHLVNALMFLVLVATGLNMQYINASGWLLEELRVAPAVPVKDTTFLMNFATAISWHNVAALIVVMGFIVFVAGNYFTGNGKYYILKDKTILRDLLVQLKFYTFGMFKGESHPFPVNKERKFNPLQKVSYVFVMYFVMPLLILSGIAMFFPEIVPDQVFGVSGLLINDLIHIISGYTLSLFLIIHFYTCTLGSKPTTLYKGMITGYHEVH